MLTCISTRVPVYMYINTRLHGYINKHWTFAAKTVYVRFDLFWFGTI